MIKMKVAATLVRSCVEICCSSFKSILFVSKSIVFASKSIAFTPQSLAFAPSSVAFASKSVAFASQSVAFVLKSVVFASIMGATTRQFSYWTAVDKSPRNYSHRTDIKKRDKEQAPFRAINHKLCVNLLNQLKQSMGPPFPHTYSLTIKTLRGCRLETWTPHRESAWVRKCTTKWGGSKPKLPTNYYSRVVSG